MPTKDSSSNLKNLATSESSTTASSATPSTTTTTTKPAQTTNGSSQQINGSAKIDTKKLELKEEFKCRASDLYRVFTDINMVRAFTQTSNLVYEAEKGGKFSLFDSNITGYFVDLKPNERIVMNWRNKRWPDEHYSLVTLEFVEKEDCTKLHLTQSGTPLAFVDNTVEGWKNFYFNSIKQVFGFGIKFF